MTVLAVDLAARYSAATLMGLDFTLLSQWDSTRFSHGEWARWLTDVAKRNSCVAIALEDLPHALKFMSGVKDTCRLQGRILDNMDCAGIMDRVWFIPPSLWQRSFDGVWRKGVDGEAAAAKSLGYEYHMPARYQTSNGQVRAEMRKVATDYVASYLQAVWAVKTWNAHGSLKVPSVTQYTGV